jgi:hypothetical protein
MLRVAGKTRICVPLDWATRNSIRVPYSVFYEIDGSTIGGLRIYMPMSELLSQIGAAADVEAAQPTP